MWLCTLAAVLALQTAAPPAPAPLPTPLPEQRPEPFEYPPRYRTQAPQDRFGMSPQATSLLSTGLGVFFGGGFFGLGVGVFAPALTITGIVLFSLGIVVGPAIGYFVRDDVGRGLGGAVLRLLAFGGTFGAGMLGILLLFFGPTAAGIALITVGAATLILGIWSLLDDLVELGKASPDHPLPAPDPDEPILGGAARTMPILWVRF